MTEHIIKLRFKTGSLEMEYEGSTAFLKEDLFETVQEMLSIGSRVQAAPSDTESSSTPPSRDTHVMDLDWTTTTYAQKLDAQSGPDLITAAIAKLMMTDNKLSVNRKELLREMQAATIYYRKSFGGNLTGSLERLVKSGDLNSVSNDNFVLSARKLADLKRIFATDENVQSEQNDQSKEENDMEEV